MIINLNTMLELIDSLEVVLKQYCSITNLLSVTDVEDTDEINRLLEEREVLITDIKVLEPQLISLIDAQAERNSGLILDMLGGRAITAALTPEECSIHQRVVNIKSLQSDILAMDRNNERRLRNKYDEVKQALIDLKTDKKKIDFCSNTKINMNGKKFNTLN